MSICRKNMPQNTPERTLAPALKLTFLTKNQTKIFHLSQNRRYETNETNCTNEAMIWSRCVTHYYIYEMRRNQTAATHRVIIMYEDFSKGCRLKFGELPRGTVCRAHEGIGLGKAKAVRGVVKGKRLASSGSDVCQMCELGT